MNETAKFRANGSLLPLLHDQSCNIPPNPTGGSIELFDKMRFLSLLPATLLFCDSSYAEEPPPVDFRKSIEGINGADLDSNGMLSEAEFKHWDKKVRGMPTDYTGYIQDGDILTLYDSDGDNLLSHQEVISYETSWRSLEGKVLRGVLLGVGNQPASISVQRDDGKVINMPLSRLDLRSQLKAYGRVNEIYQAKLTGINIEERRSILRHDLKVNPGNIFAEHRVLMSGPNGDDFAKEFSDESFDDWKERVIQFNLKYKHLAILANLNGNFANETARIGTPNQSKRLANDLVTFWKKQIGNDKEVPFVYLNAACLDQVLSFLAYKLEKNEIVIDMADLRTSAAHRGLMFHPNYTPLLNFSAIFAGLPTGVKYDRADRLKIEQVSTELPATQSRQPRSE